MSTPNAKERPPQPRWMRGLLCLASGLATAAFGLQSAVEEFDIGGQFLSRESYERIVAALGGHLIPNGTESSRASVEYLSVAFPLALFALLAWGIGGWFISRRCARPLSAALADWAWYGWLWWIVPGLWEIIRVTAFAGGLVVLPAFLTAATGLCWSLALAGWLATLCTMARSPEDRPASPTVPPRASVRPIVWLAAALFVAAFTTMNWQLYRGLLVPHGDSAMYEEHLWNLEHGKGFRSYLDRGLFLGEHIQVIHLLLIPVHLVWPSLMAMEMCQSLALASGAIPVYWIAQRHTRCSRSAALLAVAYLLYFPLHFLDVSIDLKTFRPGSFGVPALLFAIDQLERRRYAAFSCLLLLTFSAQEDFAIVCAPLGVWLAIRPTPGDSKRDDVRRSRWFGAVLALFATAYFFLVVMVVLPWFRGGVEIHYVGYLSKYGTTAGEVVQNLLAHPGMWLGDLLSARSLLFALFVVAPVGFAPLWSPGRAAVGIPLFVLLCLNELTIGDVYPRHHFHAPLVPIVFWASAAGLGNVGGLWETIRISRKASASRSSGNGARRALIWESHFVWASAFATGMLVSLGPLGRSFWDPGSDYHWRSLYVPGPRAEMFARIAGTIPKASRVASTDFVHPRFTHHERSYDYSDYPRAVNDFQPGAPPDTDYIVIDTRHPYSKFRRADQIPEFRDNPDAWELLPDDTDGYFIVLRRRNDAPRQ